MSIVNLSLVELGFRLRKRPVLMEEATPGRIRRRILGFPHGHVANEGPDGFGESVPVERQGIVLN